MPLTGIDPLDPTPSTRRELIFGAGLSSAGTARDVVLFGNRTAVGTETLDTLGIPIADDTDARARFGLRSELYNMYRKYVAVDPNATVYGVAVTESGGTAGSCTLTFATNASGSTTLEVAVTGTVLSIPIASGDTPTVVGAAVAAAINGGDEGMLMCTAAAVAGVVTITTIHLGDRGTFVIGDAGPVTRGIRARFLVTVAMTVVKAVVAPGATADDFTAAINSVANSEIYYQVSPIQLTNPSETDNQLGEHMAMIRTQSLPINGKDQVLVAGSIDTPTNAQTSATDAQMNSVFGNMFHSEGNDWTPGMIAAHNAAVMRSQQVKHPSANFAGYQNSDNTVYNIPDPFTIANRPTATEIRGMLNNGVSPIAFSSKGKAYLVRHITNRALGATAGGVTPTDYRARSGHIPSAVHFAWALVRSKWESQKQPFVADDPKDGQLPTARTSTPSQAKGILLSVIAELTASKPLGIYDGPILAPDKVDLMKKSIVVTKITAGISASVDFYAAEHNYKAESTVRETSAAY